MDHTLEVYNEDKLIFFSDSKWLHPLLELHEFLAQQNYDHANLTVNDKIIGRAAALLIIYLGIKKARAGVLSLPGKAALEYFGVQFTFEQLVDRIQCRTEEVFKDEFEPKRAYQVIRNLAHQTSD